MESRRSGAPSNRRSQRALGSGFIIDAVGHVVTNEHVVDCADIVKVKLVDEREFKAKVMGRDKRLDLAVLKTEGAKDLPYAALGSRSSAAAPSAPSARSWPRCRTSRPRGRGRCPSHPGAASSASSSS